MGNGEVQELYVDQFRVTGSAYGAALTFGLSPAHPTPGMAPPAKELVTLRMSLEHLKVMAMVLRKYLKNMEAQSGITINVPTQVLSQLGIPLEDW